jgi:hypothetical protein
MTPNKQAQAPSLLEQVLDLQATMVARGELIRPAHEIAVGKFLSRGETLIECTCGRGEIHPDAEAELAYAVHVASALGLKVRWVRAA